MVEPTRCYSDDGRSCVDNIEIDDWTITHHRSSLSVPRGLHPRGLPGREPSIVGRVDMFKLQVVGDEDQK